MSKRLQIGIVGAGGVGGYIAAKLMLGGLCDVTLFARGKHAEAIEENGLTVDDAGKLFTVTPTLTPPEQGTAFDVVLLATKAYDFVSACEEVKPFIDDETIVIPLANGVDHKRELSHYLDHGILCDGCLYITSHIQSPGEIVKKSPLFYMLFGSESQSSKLQALLQLLTQSGLKSKLSETVAYDCWKKYLFIASFATMTAYYKVPMDEIAASHKEELVKVLAEIESVALSLGIPITEEDKAKVIMQGENVPKGSKTSMQLDFEAGKKTELETLSGYIVKRACEKNIAVPLMQQMYEALSQR